MNLLLRIARRVRVSKKEIIGWITATLVLVGLDQLGLYFLDARDTPNSPPIPDSLPLTVLGFGADLFITLPLLFLKVFAQRVFGIGADFFMSNGNNLSYPSIHVLNGTIFEWQFEEVSLIG
jgi:hypothetical protein